MLEITIAELQKLRESEDHIEFKEAKHNYPFAGGKHVDLKDRRRCVLGCTSMLIQSDVVIKQYPDSITITTAGGFPSGVDMNNILTVNSVPRSKLMSEILQKAGLVERSGQGVDKMFYNCIMEGKALPDYSGTDLYQVSLTFKAPILDTAFVIFVRKVQDNRAAAEQLNVFELLALYEMAMRDYEGLDEKIL